MRAKFYVLVAGLGLLATAAPMMAHHSFTAEYDAAKPVKLTGTVTKVEWMNPHARFYIDVKDDSGTVTNWELELGSPNALMRLGWTRHSLQPRRSGHGGRVAGQGRLQARQRAQSHPGGWPQSIRRIGGGQREQGTVSSSRLETSMRSTLAVFVAGAGLLVRLSARSRRITRSRLSSTPPKPSSLQGRSPNWTG